MQGVPGVEECFKGPDDEYMRNGINSHSSLFNLNPDESLPSSIGPNQTFHLVSRLGLGNAPFWARRTYHTGNSPVVVGNIHKEIAGKIHNIGPGPALEFEYASAIASTLCPAFDSEEEVAFRNEKIVIDSPTLSTANITSESPNYNIILTHSDER